MSLRETQRFEIPIKNGYPVGSLCWQGDELVDWAWGGRYGLDGSVDRKGGGWGSFFDSAVASPDGKYAVIYGRLGTKGLILKEGKLLREINRSFYRADDYEYPIVLFTLPDGRTVIAHCPEEYNKIEIEEVDSGKRLTARASEPIDFFHSRLRASSDGKYLLSAGWVWQPCDVLEIYNVAEVLKCPDLLNGTVSDGAFPGVLGVTAADFRDNNSVVYAAEEECKPVLGLFNLKTATVDWGVSLEEACGAIMPIGTNYLLSFYNHPKLVEVSTGKVLHRWPELNSGQQISSIIHHVGKIPPLALDPQRKRFAVADEKQITVIQLGEKT